MTESSLACSDCESVRSGAFVLVGAIIVLLLAAAMPAVAATETGDGEEYLTSQYNAQRTGAVSGTAPDTATLLWQSNDKTAGCVEAGPIVHDGKVYVSTWRLSGMGVAGDAVDALYCLDQASGEKGIGTAITVIGTISRSITRLGLIKTKRTTTL